MEKWFKKYRQSIFPVQILHVKTSNPYRRCSNVSRLITARKGEYKKYGSLGIDHLNEMKRKNFWCTFPISI